MIIEYYKYLTNPANKSAKMLGQLRETIALEARYKRSRMQWASHLDNTKALIKDSSQLISKPKEVIVLGSGLLLDIPIEFLSKHFQHVYLLDVVHLKSTKQSIKNFRNITFIEHDITGLSEQLIFSPSHNNQDLTHQPAIPKLSANTSLVVSSNMLSQLHLPIVDFVEKKLKYDTTKQEELAIKIIQAHLAMLADLSCQVCLITDYIREYTNEVTNMSEKESALLGVQLPTPDRKWQWQIAPKGELDKNISMMSEVYGYLNYKL